MVRGTWRKNVEQVYSVNAGETFSNDLSTMIQDDKVSPKVFAKLKFGEYFGQVPSYLDKEQQDEIFAAFVQADQDDLHQDESYEDHTDFTSFKDDEVSVERWN